MKRLLVGITNIVSNIAVLLVFPLLALAWIVRVHALEHPPFRLTRRARPRA